MAAREDPAFGIVKTLEVEYTLNGKHLRLTGTDPETVDFVTGPVPPRAIVQVRCDAAGRPRLEAAEPGEYEIQTASGHSRRVKVDAPLAPFPISGPWEVSFDPKWGGPERADFPQLEDWSQRPEDGIRYYSGTAVYRKTFAFEPQSPDAGPVFLDLGKVAIMAEVNLNGHDLGILWKPPFRVEVTGLLKPGENRLEVKVVNLWINRMIGDERLPEDSERNGDGTLKQWPAWVNEGKPSPTGRYTFTSWRLWKKSDPLLPSGLLGPVTFQSVQAARLD
jgi:hypothetical protein